MKQMRKILLVILFGLMTFCVGCGATSESDDENVSNETVDNNVSNSDVESDNDDLVIALDEGTFIEAITRYEEKEIDVTNIYLFGKEFTQPLSLETIMSSFTWGNNEDNTSAAYSLAEYIETNPTFTGRNNYEDLECYIDGERTYHNLRIFSSYDLDTDFTFNECYENNYWGYFEDYSYLLEECLGIPEDKNIVWNSENLFETFGTPDSIVLEGGGRGDNLKKYLNTTELNVSYIDLVYNLEGCKLILIYTEVSHNDGSFGGENFAGFYIISNEAYEDCTDYFAFDDRIELWNREEGYTFD